LRCHLWPNSSEKKDQRVEIEGFPLNLKRIPIFQYFSSKQKLTELQISYSQKSYDRQIESARNHLDNLYLPLYKEISSLHYRYIKYLNVSRISEESEKEKQNLEVELNNLLKAIDNFNKIVENIFENGMNAYLIGVIEEKLIDLKDLLNESTKDTDTTIKRKVTTTIYTPFFELSGASKTKDDKYFRYIPRSINYQPKSLFPFFSWEIGTRVETKLLRAPLISTDFENEFVRYISEIKNDMRKVTLWKS